MSCNNLSNPQQYEDRYGNEIKRQRLDDAGNHLKVWRVCEFKYILKNEDEDEVPDAQEQVPDAQEQEQAPAPMQVIGRVIIIYTVQNTAIRGVIQNLFDLNGERAIQIQTNQGENLIFTSSQMVGLEVLHQDVPVQVQVQAPVPVPVPVQVQAPAHELIQIEDDEDDQSHDNEDDDECYEVVQIDEDDDDFPGVEFMPARREQPQQPQQPQQEEEHDCCAICLDITDAARNFVSLDCGHQFHFACIIGNMANGGRNRNQCPMCRSTVVQQYEVHNEEEMHNHNNEENVNDVIDRLARSNQRLQDELDLNQQHRADLTEEYVRVMSMNLQISTRHREERVARDALERRAEICFLNERIVQVVQNAANNDIRQNYEHGASVHMERQIRDLCMSFGMMAYDAQYDDQDQQDPDAQEQYQEDPDAQEQDYAGDML